MCKYSDTRSSVPIAAAVSDNLDTVKAVAGSNKSMQVGILKLM